MIRRFFFFIACALLFVCQASPVNAARLSAGGFSAELPKGWQVSEEGNAVFFASSPKGPHVFRCLIASLERPDLGLYLSRKAKDGKLQKLGDMSYLYVDAFAGRCWIMTNKDGMLFSISTEEPAKAMPGFLKSLKPEKSTATVYTEFFKEAQSQAVVDWLAFTAPDLPAREPAKTGETGSVKKRGKLVWESFTGKGIKAKVPADWAIETAGRFVYFTAPGGREYGYAAGAAIPLKSNDYDVYVETCTGIIDELGGKNVSSGEGMIEFQLAENGTGMFSMDRGTALFVMHQWNDDTSKKLADSIGLVVRKKAAAASK